MKLWLMEILACPIDKHFPLELTIFQWQGEKDEIFSTYEEETDESEENYATSSNRFRSQAETQVLTEDPIKQLIEKLHHGTLNATTREERSIKLHKEPEHNVWTISDLLQIKPVPVEQYFQHLLSMIQELNFIKDISTWEGEQALQLIRSEISTQIKDHLKNILSNNGQIMEIHEEEDFWAKLIAPVENALEFLNQFKYCLEIQEGVIKCSHCNRWYPIFETIPQMLPDSVRPQDTDAAFKDLWQDKYQFPT